MLVSPEPKSAKFLRSIDAEILSILVAHLLSKWASSLLSVSVFILDTRRFAQHSLGRLDWWVIAATYMDHSYAATVMG